MDESALKGCSEEAKEAKELVSSCYLHLGGFEEPKWHTCRRVCLGSSLFGMI